MIGHSMGGYITIAFAEKYPELLNGFGFFHSSAFTDDEEKKQIRLKAIEFIKKNGAEAFLKTSIPGLFTDEFIKNYSYRVENLIETAKQFSPEALVQYYYAMINRPDRTDVLKSVNKPVLFIIGEKDKAIPLQASLKQCHLPAISHITILKNSAHMGMLEEKEKCIQTVLGFLQSL